ncbi:hypothetical protein ACWDYH_09830 [Nocardia goodfellowii]
MPQSPHANSTQRSTLSARARGLDEAYADVVLAAALTALRA